MLAPGSTRFRLVVIAERENKSLIQSKQLKPAPAPIPEVQATAIKDAKEK